VVLISEHVLGATK